MRLWSIHPKYLDRAGLIALWRESLLAQKVLKGQTKGYKNHPQLNRFKNNPKPQKAIGEYLFTIWKEANKRGYKFNKSKIKKTGNINKLVVTYGQLEFEFNLLLQKCRERDLQKCQELQAVDLKEIDANPIFRIIKGKAEEK